LKNESYSAVFTLITTMSLEKLDLNFQPSKSELLNFYVVNLIL
jgi:hypothetical protein